MLQLFIGWKRYSPKPFFVGKGEAEGGLQAQRQKAQTKRGKPYVDCLYSHGCSNPV